MQAVDLTFDTAIDNSSTEEKIMKVKAVLDPHAGLVCSQNLVNEPTAYVLEVTSLEALSTLAGTWTEAMSVAPNRVLLISCIQPNAWASILTESVQSKSAKDGALLLTDRAGGILARPRLLQEQINSKKFAARSGREQELPTGEKRLPTITTTVTVSGVANKMSTQAADKVVAAIMKQLPWEDRIDWSGSPPTGETVAARKELRNGKWNGRISIKSKDMQIHETAFNALEDFNLNMGGSPFSCKTANSAGVQWVRRIALQ